MHSGLPQRAPQEGIPGPVHRKQDQDPSEIEDLLLSLTSATDTQGVPVIGEDIRADLGGGEKAYFIPSRSFQ